MTAPPGSREIRENASEVKFAVDREAASRIRTLARALLSPDPHASGPNADEYLTTTIYFDTADFAVYHRRGSYRRAKYRIRRYGEGPVIFLERKLRTSEMVSKRRTCVPIEDQPLLDATIPELSWSGRWFHARLLARKLSPVCQVGYVRTARICMTDFGPARLTVDEELNAVPVDGQRFEPMGGATPLSAATIVEMKFRGPLPAAFKRIVEEFALASGRISKYRLGIEGTRPNVVTRPEVAAALPMLNRLLDGQSAEVAREAPPESLAWNTLQHWSGGPSDLPVPGPKTRRSIVLQRALGTEE